MTIRIVVAVSFWGVLITSTQAVENSKDCLDQAEREARRRVGEKALQDGPNWTAFPSGSPAHYGYGCWPETVDLRNEGPRR